MSDGRQAEQGYEEGQATQDEQEGGEERSPEGFRSLPERRLTFPEFITVGSVSYRLTDDPVDWQKIENKTMRKGDYGHMDSLTATIYLNPEQADDVKRLTVWHEALHAMLETVCGAPAWKLKGNPDEREEAVIRILESPTLLLLQDNPDLVDYLTW